MKLHNLNDTYEHNVEAVKDAATFAAITIRSFREKKSKILADGRYSDQGKAQQIAKVLDEAKADLASTFEQAKDAISELRDVTAEVLSEDNRSVEQQLLDELKLGRAWARYERLLDAHRDPLAVVDSAADDSHGLRALRAELPAYLEAGNNTGIFDGVRAALDRAEEPHLSDVQREARQIQRELADNEHLIILAEDSAYSELENVQGGVIPKWTGGVVKI